MTEARIEKTGEAKEQEVDVRDIKNVCMLDHEKGKEKEEKAIENSSYLRMA